MTNYDRFCLNILKVIFQAIKYFFMIAWHGIKNVFTSRKKIVVLIAGTGGLWGLNYILTTLHIADVLNGWWLIFLFIYVFGVNGGIGDRVKKYIIGRGYQKIFESINFVSTDELYPGYAKTTFTENMKIITFYSTIPLSVWLKKQDLLESAFNERFYEIKDRQKNNRVIDVYVLTKELANVIPWNDSLITNGDVLNIGEGYFGTVGMNLPKQPHAFIAGETGSGKSIILQCMIYQALKKKYKVSLIDFKRGVSFSGFSGLVDMVVELEQADRLLSGLIQEVNRRLDLFVAEGVQDIKDYNQKMVKSGVIPLQRIIVVVDELAELVDAGGADKEEKAVIQAINRNLRTLARIARAPGVHLLLGIQRPDSNIIDGQIKSNIPFRVCGRFADTQPSVIVLGNDQAAKLPDIPGRFIANACEVQAYYFKTEHLEKLCSHTEKAKCSCQSCVEQTKIQKENIQEESQKITTTKSPENDSERFDLDFSEIDL